MFKKYIFPDPNANFKVYLVMMLLLCGLLILSIGILKLKKTDLTKRISRWLRIMPMIGIIIYLFRYEGVMYFDSSLWIWVLFITTAVWLLWIIAWRLFYAPKLKVLSKKIDIKSKYLPKPKKPLRGGELKMKEKHG